MPDRQINRELKEEAAMHVRAKALARFQQPEPVLRALIESPQNIVIFALDRQYRYLAYNKSHARTMAKIWGVQIGVGLNMLALIGRDDDRLRARTNFDRALSGESFTLIEEYGDTRMERCVYENVYSPVRDEQGEIIGVALYLTDITEHRRSQLELDRHRNHLEELVLQRTRELEEAHIQLLRAQKAESLGVLAGGIAHDFNNLLAIVLARAELCQRDGVSVEACRSHVGIIRDTAFEARLLTKQLLSYAGKGRFLVETVALDQVVKGIFPLVRASVSKAIRLRVERGSETVPVVGDATQLRQILLNLVTNAAEAIGDAAGTIIVRTGVEEAAGEKLGTACLATDTSPGLRAFLEVQDDGAGVDEAHRSKLFDPFFTTKFSGRGLGLAAVLGIVKGHGGSILVDSKPGQGSRFRVSFPLGDEREITASGSGQRAVKKFRGKGCALVVDDEGAVRCATAEFLHSVGYRVLQADGGQSARRIFGEHADEIDVVLLDWAMPDMNGEETLRELKSIRADVRVILLTAYAEDECLGRFVPGDLAGFVTKPFAQDELVEALQRATAPTFGRLRQG